MCAGSVAGTTGDQRACASSRLELRLDSPFANREWVSHGFLGAWCPGRPLRVHGTDLDGALAGEHWFLLAATEPGTGQRVHHDAASDTAVAFDGYVVDPPLHQGSPAAAITAFWAARHRTRVNGNFAAAVIDGAAGELSLRTDAFGFAPLYYRVLDGAVLFATHADYLLSPGMEMDRAALFSVLGNGLIVGDRSLFAGIRRVPLGGALTFSDPHAEPRRPRFDLEVAGEGTSPLTAKRMDELQALFRQSIDRCLELRHGESLIALSSGLDSRRILGALLDAGERPPALTVRIQPDDSDVDATFAAQITGALGLEHTVVDLPAPADYARDNDLRRRVLGAETPMHDWSPTLQRAYPAGAAMIFKGFLGDTLHEPIHNWEDVFADPARDIEQVASHFATNPLGPLLSPDMQAGGAVGDIVREQLAAYADRPHVADLAEMVLFMRRGIAFGSQMLRPRHLEMRPFLDLDFMRAILDVDPRAKQASPVRSTFLERFHPRLARFGGSGDYAGRPAPRTDSVRFARELAYVTRIARDVPLPRQQARLAGLLSPRGRALSLTTRLAPRYTGRWYWAMRPVFEAALHGERAAPVWHPG